MKNDYLCRLIGRVKFCFFMWPVLLKDAVVAQMVEHQLPKLRVVGSIPIYRSSKIKGFRISEALFLLLAPEIAP